LAFHRAACEFLTLILRGEFGLTTVASTKLRFVYAALSGAFLLANCSMPQGLLLPDIPASEKGAARTPSSVFHGAEGRTSQGTQIWGAAEEPQRPASLAEQLGRTNQKAVVAEAGRDGITLNLVDAPIADAAKAVLGDILKVNYIIDSRVKGTVTVQTTRPVSQTAILDIFDAVLSAQGARLVAAGEVHKIVPANEAAAAGAPLRVSFPKDRSRLPPGAAIYIVPLEHVSAPEMEQVLKSVSRENSIVRVDAARNLLMLLGTPSEMTAMIEAIEIFDVDSMRGMSFALLQVDSADPAAVAQELDALFSNDAAGPARGLVRFVPSQRLKAVLVISPKPEFLRRATAFFNRLQSVSRATERQMFSYKVRNRPASELAQLLLKLYGGSTPSATTRVSVTGTETVTSSTDNRPEGRLAPPNASSAAASAGAALVDPARAGQSNDPVLRTASGTLQTDERAMTRGSVTVVPDEANRMLLITTTRDEYNRILSLLHRIDTMPEQLLIEATIAEITLKDQLKMGVKWYFETGKNQFSLTNSLAGAISPAFPGFSYFFNAANIRVVLDALGEVTDVNIVSSPSLTVLDGKRATLQVGDEVPILTQEVVAVVTPGAPVVNSVIYRNTGVILGIVPRINDKGFIVLEIEQEVSDVGATTSSSINSPSFTQRRIKTTVVVKDGESITLGGIIQDRSSLGRNQIPLLGDVPGIGNLFKYKDDTVRRTELLIFITPRVVRDAEQTRNITDEFRDKLNLSLRPQRQGPPTTREKLDRFHR
jgi:general secretion pathway protein D